MQQGCCATEPLVMDNGGDELLGCAWEAVRATRPQGCRAQLAGPKNAKRFTHF